jgi:hypothetical protein
VAEGDPNPKRQRAGFQRMQADSIHARRTGWWVFVLLRQRRPVQQIGAARLGPKLGDLSEQIEHGNDRLGAGDETEPCGRNGITGKAEPKPRPIASRHRA